MNELLSCPFCGSSASVRISEELQDVSDVSNLVVACDNPKCQIYQKELHETFEDAISAWNTRAPVDKWISTKDRFPTKEESDRELLLYRYPDETMRIGIYLFEYNRFFTSPTDRWFCKNVTHWMFRPELPHETTEKDE